MTSDDSFNEKVSNFIDQNSPAIPDSSELERLSQHVSEELPVTPRGKIKELSIFTIGLGVILAVLTSWLSYAMQPVTGQGRSALTLLVPLGISMLFIILGVLTRCIGTPLIVKITMATVTVGFGLDLLLGFNVIKAIIVCVIIGLVFKTGRQALIEARAKVATPLHGEKAA